MPIENLVTTIDTELSCSDSPFSMEAVSDRVLHRFDFLFRVEQSLYYPQRLLTTLQSLATDSHVVLIISLLEMTSSSKIIFA